MFVKHLNGFIPARSVFVSVDLQQTHGYDSYDAPYENARGKRCPYHLLISPALFPSIPGYS